MRLVDAPDAGQPINQNGENAGDDCVAAVARRSFIRRLRSLRVFVEHSADFRRFLSGQRFSFDEGRMRGRNRTISEPIAHAASSLPATSAWDVVAEKTCTAERRSRGPPLCVRALEEGMH